MTTVNVTAAIADYLTESVQPGGGQVNTTDLPDGRVAARLDDRAHRILASLPADCDGHIDADGTMWVGGVEYPVTTDEA